MTSSRLALAWRLLTAEGPRSIANRLAEHVAERRRRARFEALPRPLGGAERVPVLTLLGSQLAPRIGGVPTQLLTRLEAFEALRKPYALLYPEAQDSFRLEVWRPERAWTISVPAPPLPTRPTLDDPGFADVLLRGRKLAGASALHVEHLGPLPISAALRAREAGYRLWVSAHDFHLFCPRPHLLEQPTEAFCHYSRDFDRCAACLGESWTVERELQARRRAQAAELLRAATGTIFPSSFLRDRFLELFPALDARSTHVVEPGVPNGAMQRPRSQPADARRRGPIHVAYAGAIEVHKGSRELEALIATMRESIGHAALCWTVFGGGDPATLRRLRRIPNVRIWGYYRRGTLPELLRRTGVDAVLLLSRVPEAFGLTLSEARLAGVPVLAFDHGAVGERARASGGAVLVPPKDGVPGLHDHLLPLLQRAEHRLELASESMASPVTTAAENALAVLRLHSEAGPATSSERPEAPP